MPNENETMNTNPDTSTEQDYIDTIAELRRNSVPKADFDKLREDNRKLMKTLAEGGSIESQAPAKDTRSIDDLRRAFFSDVQSNKQYWQNALDLRDKIIAEGGRDPALPFSHNYVPTDDDYAAVERVAEGIKHCIEVADGNDSIFINEYQRVTVDPVPSITSRRR